MKDYRDEILETLERFKIPEMHNYLWDPRFTGYPYVPTMGTVQNTAYLSSISTIKKKRSAI